MLGRAAGGIDGAAIKGVEGDVLQVKELRVQVMLEG